MLTNQPRCLKVYSSPQYRPETGSTLRGASLFQFLFHQQIREKMLLKSGGSSELKNCHSVLLSVVFLMIVCSVSLLFLPETHEGEE